MNPSQIQNIHNPFIAFNQQVDRRRKTFGPKLNNNTKITNELKAASIAGTAAGTLTALYFVAKQQMKQGTLNSSKSILSNMFNIKFNKPRTLLALGAGTVVGGLGAGLLADKKEHHKAKMREGIHQFIGNIFMPLIIAEGGFQMIEKYNLSFPEFKNMTKSAKTANLVIRALPKTMVSLFAIVAGIQSGNLIANKILKDDRTVKPTDYCVHADDIFEIAAFLDESGHFKSFLGKVLPLTYSICGYLTGVAKEKNM